MPRLSVPARRSRRFVPRVVVLGDLMVDVVLAPTAALVAGTDVPGRVTLRQGGSAANTARWLARLGARTTLIGAVGRDQAGRALVDAVRSDGVVARVSRIAGERTGRIGVLVTPTGDRSFVADRGAADHLEALDLRAAWFEKAELLHLPIYSMLGDPLGGATRRALRLARLAGAQVSLDLSSIGPLLAGGRRAATTLVQFVNPDLLFATGAEAEALLGQPAVEGLLAFAPIAVVKRGPEGATVLAAEGANRLRFEVATERKRATDTTGAGDAFDAGFIVEWLASRAAGRALPAALQRAALAGHRAAARQLRSAPSELPLG
ncbi:MAG: carbohydrate kinase family protein [Chloroflexota bacterium]|nr:carbohydrate kinase family protein [Chloroflexota bacterium]